MQEYNDGIILFSAISIYVSPLTSVLRSNECQQALFTFHLQISVLSNTQCVEYGKYTYCQITDISNFQLIALREKHFAMSSIYVGHF
ncbi:hypothetical protein T08_13413 [Trichinella sp. T8]|nr:hypothetical protein T08_13413 [Trichinella sp. T8]